MKQNLNMAQRSMEMDNMHKSTNTCKGYNGGYKIDKMEMA